MTYWRGYNNIFLHPRYPPPPGWPRKVPGESFWASDFSHKESVKVSKRQVSPAVWNPTQETEAARALGGRQRDVDPLGSLLVSRGERQQWVSAAGTWAPLVFHTGHRLTPHPQQARCAHLLGQRVQAFDYDHWECTESQLESEGLDVKRSPCERLWTFSWSP